ncbi:MAG: toxin-antitoxin system YwqK family antitoxin [Planctomycetes bacterium]|nr:toxin-antitoxin system YwqK family antitoxin [Planctomycetota bacterium]MBI3832962.1 toxin-antitoxin system YwqK family antitoxin [Planctomycetota bacterium]
MIRMQSREKFALRGFSWSQRASMGVIVAIALVGIPNLCAQPGAAQETPPSAKSKETPLSQPSEKPVGGGTTRESLDSGANEPAPPEGVDGTKIKLVAFEEMHPNGKVKSRAEGYHGPAGKLIKHGRYQEWNEAGQLILDTHYMHDIQHGMRKVWYPSGQLQSEVNYINGKEDGTYTKYFPDGKTMSVWHMKLGAWDGMYTDYHRTGQKKIEVEFVNGLRQGPQSQWDENGVLIQKSDYTDGVEQP